MDADPESLELAMALHRELNAPQRRSRRDPEEDKNHKNEQKRGEAESTSASSSDEEEDEDDHADADHNQTQGEEQKPPLHGAAARRAKHKRRRKSPPRQLDPHEIAAATAIQKAAKSAKGKNSGPIGQTHCKCFIAGIPWGVIIPKEALESIQSLSEAASKAFEKDGFVCTAEELEISIVAASRNVEYFPSPLAVAAGGGGGGLIGKKQDLGVNKIEEGAGIYKEGRAVPAESNGEIEDRSFGAVERTMAEAVGAVTSEKEEDEEQQQERWAAATQHAQRVYLSKFKLEKS